MCPSSSRFPIDPTSTIQFIHRPLLAEHIRTCDPRPSMAFSEARRFQPEVNKNWKYDNIKAVRLFVPGFPTHRINGAQLQMETTIWHKFTQHGGLREELLSTGDAELIEVCGCYYHPASTRFTLKFRTPTRMRFGVVVPMERAGTSWAKRL